MSQSQLAAIVGSHSVTALPNVQTRGDPAQLTAQDELMSELITYVGTSHSHQGDRDQKIGEMTAAYERACAEISSEGVKLVRTMNDKVTECIQNIDVSNPMASKGMMDTLLQMSEQVANNSRDRTVQALEDQKQVYLQKVELFFGAKQREHQLSLDASSEALSQCQLRMQNEVVAAKDLADHRMMQYQKASDMLVQHERGMQSLGKCATPGCSCPHAAGYVHCCRTCAATGGTDHGPICRSTNNPGVWVTPRCTELRGEGFIHCYRACAVGSHQPAPQMVALDGRMGHGMKSLGF